MSYLALYRSSRWGISMHAEEARIPAAELPALLGSLALAQQVEQIATDEIARVEEARVQGRTAGHAQGHAEGLAAAHLEAMDALSEVLHALSLDSERERSELRQALAALTTLALRRVLGELPPEASLQALVSKALDQTLPEAPVVVRLHPQALARVASALQKMPRSGPMLLEADEHLDLWGCELHTPTGRLLAGLDDQLRSVQQTLSRQLQPAVRPVSALTDTDLA